MGEGTGISTHTPLAGRDMLRLTDADFENIISTHTPLAGRDFADTQIVKIKKDFYSHAPCGARHAAAANKTLQQRDFYSHAPCGARRTRTILAASIITISTHTPLAGRDNVILLIAKKRLNFYSHAPCGARQFYEQKHLKNHNFYSHAPCGARRIHPTQKPVNLYISTHTPLAGRDRSRRGKRKHGRTFLLTRPLRGATATYSIRIYRTSYIQEADLKIITKYAIKLNMLHDSGIKSRRTSPDYTHHSTFACCFH